MKNSRVRTNTGISRKTTATLTIIIMCFSTFAIILNPLQFTYSVTLNSANISTNNKNITKLDLNSLSNNSISSPVIPVGNVTISKIPRPRVSTDVTNVTEQPEPSPANLSSFAFSKMQAETSNASFTASKKQFSISPFVNNSLVNKTKTSEYNNSSVSNSSSNEPSPARKLSSIDAAAADRSYNNLADPPVVPKNFQTEGLNINTAGSRRMNPPDPQIAVGPNHIVEMSNLAAGFWLKIGVPLQTVDLPLFFKTGSDLITDPRVLYDNDTGKWFASIQDMTNDTVVLSVSQTSDPTAGNWTISKLRFSGCPDQQKIGISKDKVVISANVVQDNCPTYPQYKGGQFIILNKSDLIRGIKPSLDKLFVSKLIPSFFSIHPAEFLSSNESSAIFMVTLGEQGLYGGKTVTTYIVNGTLPNIEVKNLTLTVQPVEQPVSAIQPGNTPIDTGDARVQDANWQNGHLWVAANDRCVQTGDEKPRDCIRLIEINTNNYTVTQDFDISLNRSYLFYPALGIDHAGNLAVIFGYSSQDLNYYPGVMVGGQSATGTSNKLDNVVNFTSGLSSSNTDRYGDYNAIAIDPTHPMSFWGVAQRIPAPLTDPGVTYWDTVIGNFTALGSSNTRR